MVFFAVEKLLTFSSVQSLSRVQLFVTPCIAAHQASLSITNLEFTQTHIRWVSDAIQPSHPHSNPKERQCQRMLKLPHNCTHLSSVQFSCSVVSNSMQSHELQWPCLPVHHQLPEFTKTHIHQVWCHTSISFSVVPFFSCPQSLPASEFFPMSQLFAWGGKVLEFQL